MRRNPTCRVPTGKRAGVAVDGGALLWVFSHPVTVKEAALKTHEGLTGGGHVNGSSWIKRLRGWSRIPSEPWSSEKCCAVKPPKICATSTHRFATRFFFRDPGRTQLRWPFGAIFRRRSGKESIPAIRVMCRQRPLWPRTCPWGYTAKCPLERWQRPFRSPVSSRRQWPSRGRRSTTRHLRPAVTPQP